MPIISTYIFWSGNLFDGFFQPSNEKKSSLSGLSPGLHFISNFQVFAARPDSEKTIDLGPIVNAQVAPQIVPILGGDISLTSSIQAQITPWMKVGYFWQKPNAHSTMTLFVRIHFNLHVNTPWYMSDADADVSLYVLPGLKNGKVTAKVDGAWVKVHGGWPDGQAIADKLGKIAIKAIPEAQSAINSALAPLAAASFSSLYPLPGNGTQSAQFTIQDATADTALAVVP